MLLETAGNRAGLGRELSVEEVEASLKGSFEQRPAVVAGAVGHVIGSHVRRGTARSPEAYAEAAWQIQQDLRHKITGIAQSELTFFLGLPHQGVIGLLQQILEIDQVF